MPHLFRQIHLITGFVTLSFVLMYFVSGWVMDHETLFEDVKPVEQAKTMQLDARAITNGLDPQDLRHRLGVNGRGRDEGRTPSGLRKYSFHRPGYFAQAQVATDTGQATIIERRLNWRRTLIGFHRFHGYSGNWMHLLWAVLYDLASLSMIVFGITGVVLWYNLCRHNRTPGWIILGAGFAFTAATVVYLVKLP